MPDNVRKILPDAVLADLERVSRRFGPGGDLAPIEDRFEYEAGLKELAPEDRALVEELTRFADLCKYFSDRNEKLGTDIDEAVSTFPKLPLPERILAVRKINQKLMERVGDAGAGSQFRV